MSVVPSLTTVSIVVTNNVFISSKYPLAFLTFSLVVSDFFDNGTMVLDEMFLVLDLLQPVNSITSSRF